MRIEVNHQTLRNAAAAITAYCEEQERQMRQADAGMQSLLSGGYQGMDASELRHKWAGINAADSAAVSLRKSLEAYSQNLTAVANAYQSAQAAVYDLANRLPKWLYW